MQILSSLMLSVTIFHLGFVALAWAVCIRVSQLIQNRCCGVRLCESISRVCLVAHLATLAGADSIVVSWRFVLTYEAGLVDAGWRWRWGGAGDKQVLSWARALSLYSCRRTQRAENQGDLHLVGRNLHAFFLSRAINISLLCTKFWGTFLCQSHTSCV